MEAIENKSITQQNNCVESLISKGLYASGLTPTGVVVFAGTAQYVPFNPNSRKSIGTYAVDCQPGHNEQPTMLWASGGLISNAHQNIYSKFNNCLLESERVNGLHDETQFLSPAFMVRPKTADLYRLNHFSAREINNIVELNASYKKEFDKLKKVLTFDSGSISRAFETIRKGIVSLPFEGCAVEINEHQALKITLSFSNERLLMITKNFADKYFEEKIIYSFFLKRKLISSDIINFQDFLRKFSAYINN